MPAITVLDSDLRQIATARQYAAADTVAKRRELLAAANPDIYGPQAKHQADDQMINAMFIGALRYLLGDLANIIGNLMQDSDEDSDPLAASIGRALADPGNLTPAELAELEDLSGE